MLLFGTCTHDLYFYSTFQINSAILRPFKNTIFIYISYLVKDTLLLFLIEFRIIRSQSQTAPLESQPEMFSVSERWPYLVHELAHLLLLVLKFHVLLYTFWHLHCWW